MAQTMSMGQAAGLAAVLSIEQDCAVGTIPVATLQSRLQAVGAVLELPAQIAQTAADAWRQNRGAK
jgi:hypothetical protein